MIPNPVTWIQREFLIPETRHDPKLKGRLLLQPYQADALTQALAKDENGNYRYSIIVWSDIKKSAKSTIAAAINLFRATFTEWGEFYVIANDLKQANSRVAEYIRRAVLLNPKMRDKYKLQGYKITAPSGSFIEAIPIDPTGEAGTNADQVTFSELWGAHEDAQQHMWSEMTIPPQKHGKAFRWIETYAGFAEESKLLWSLYDLGVRQGTLLWPDKLYNVTDGTPTPLELYENKEAGMLCLWNTQPRCPWQTQDYYNKEAQILPVSQFNRIHRNQWVSSVESFVPPEWIGACERKNEEWPAIDRQHQGCVLALDAGTTNDCFGMWLGCRHPKFDNEVLTLLVYKWVPNQFTGKIDFKGTEEKPGPELVLRKIVRDYNVIQVCYDPYQLYDFCNQLNKEGLAWFKQFDQQRMRLLADSQFRDLIRDRRFWHRGEPDLIEHIKNANAHTDEEGSKIRIVKRTDKLKIDVAVAASMGSYSLLYLNL